MNESENDEKFDRTCDIARVYNRINFLAITERPFYVKRAVAREAMRFLEKLR